MFEKVLGDAWGLSRAGVFMGVSQGSEAEQRMYTVPLAPHKTDPSTTPALGDGKC